jgi:hypothetical protein
VNNINETVKVGNNMVTSKRLNEQQRHNSMKKFMANGKSSTSFYWKDDSISRNNNNNNNRPTNVVNSLKNLSNNKIRNRPTNINNSVGKKLSDDGSEEYRSNYGDQLDNNEEILSGKSNSCLKLLSVNNEDAFKNLVIFNPSGSEKNKLERQTVTAILNNDEERYQNDNTTKNDMNFNNDSENNVLSRSIINANTNVCLQADETARLAIFGKFRVFIVVQN